MHLHTSVFELMDRSLVEFEAWEQSVIRVVFQGK
jgi:hypothetical protein